MTNEYDVGNKFADTDAASVKAPLPSGLTEFHAWADDIIVLAGAPNNDSVKFALATMILHAKAEDCNPPKSQYVNQLKKTMANQVASHVINELKAKQEAQREAERLAQIEAESNVTKE